MVSQLFQARMPISPTGVASSTPPAASGSAERIHQPVDDVWQLGQRGAARRRAVLWTHGEHQRGRTCGGKRPYLWCKVMTPAACRAAPAPLGAKQPSDSKAAPALTLDTQRHDVVHASGIEVTESASSSCACRCIIRLTGLAVFAVFTLHIRRRRRHPTRPLLRRRRIPCTLAACLFHQPPLPLLPGPPVCGRLGQSHNL